MELKDQNVLFFTRTMKLGGTENVVLQLCEIFKPLVNKIVVCSCGGVNVEKLNEVGIRHYGIPDIEKKSPETIMKVSKELRKIVSTEKITVIHTHHRMAAFYVTLLGLYKKCCFINTSHNTFSDKKKLTTFSYKHANIVACGEMVKKNLVDFFGIQEQKVTVIHNAVKPFCGSIVENYLIKQLHEEGYFVIGNVGRLSKQKGLDYFIKSIPIVIKNYPETRFLIIGSGEEEEKLKKLTKEMQIEDYLYFTGYCSEVQNIMAQLDLVVLSSLWEGLPLTPIEAFSVGRSIIATAVDGTVEIVKNGENGLLVTAKNSDDLAEKIVWMMSHPEQRVRMEKGAKKQYEDSFSFRIFAERYINYYKELN